MRKPRLFGRRRRAALLGLLAEHGPLRLTDMCRRVGWYGSAWSTLTELERDGLIESERVDEDGATRRYWRLATTAPVAEPDDAQATLAHVESALAEIRAKSDHGSFFDRPGLEVAGDLLWNALHNTDETKEN